MPRIDSVAWLGAAKGKKVKITQVDSGEWLRRIEAARLLGVSARQLERHAQKGSIARQYLPRIGTEKSARAVYSRADIETLLTVQEEAVLAAEISRHRALINEEATEGALRRPAPNPVLSAAAKRVWASRTPEQRTAIATKAAETWLAASTPEERSAIAKNNGTPEQRSAAGKKGAESRLASTTPEQRSALAKKAAKAAVSRTPQQLRESAKKANASRTPEQRSAIARKGNATRWASITKEQRSAIARKANASRTPEQRSAIAKKARAAQTAKRDERQ